MYDIIRLDFDRIKSNKNAAERGLPFECALEIDWETAHIEEDLCRDYMEHRFVAYGYRFGKLHVCCFTPIPGGIRIISLRRGNKREERKYEKETADRQEW